MQQLSTHGDKYDNIKTELNRTEQKILKFIRGYQPVCRKVVKLNAASYGESVIDDKIRSLLDRELLEEDFKGSLSLTKKGKSQVSTSKTTRR